MKRICESSYTKLNGDWLMECHISEYGNIEAGYYLDDAILQYINGNEREFLIRWYKYTTDLAEWVSEVAKIPFDSIMEFGQDASIYLNLKDIEEEKLE